MSKSLIERIYLYILVGFIVLAPSSINMLVKIHIYGVEFRLENIIIILSNVMFIINFICIKKIVLNFLDKVYIILLNLFMIFGTINALQDINVLLNLFLNINNLMTPFFIYLYIKKRNDKDKIIRGMIYIASFIMIQVLVGIFLGNEMTTIMGWSKEAISGNGGMVRVRTSLGAATITGIFLLIVFFVALSFEFKKNILTFIILIASFLTMSRSVVVGGISFFVIIGFVFRKKILELRFWHQKKNIYTICLVIIALLFFVNTEAFTRMIGRFQVRENSSNNSRIELLRESLEILPENIFLGKGLGSGYERINHLIKEGIVRNPHNSSLGVLLEGGIFIYTLFLIVFSGYVIYGMKVNKVAAIGVVTSLFIISNFEAFYLSNIEVMIYIWLLISLSSTKERGIES